MLAALAFIIAAKSMPMAPAKAAPAITADFRTSRRRMPPRYVFLIAHSSSCFVWSFFIGDDPGEVRIPIHGHALAFGSTRELVLGQQRDHQMLAVGALQLVAEQRALEIDGDELRGEAPVGQLTRRLVCQAEMDHFGAQH